MGVGVVNGELTELFRYLPIILFTWQAAEFIAEIGSLL